MRQLKTPKKQPQIEPVPHTMPYIHAQQHSICKTLKKKKKKESLEAYSNDNQKYYSSVLSNAIHP